MARMTNRVWNRSGNLSHDKEFRFMNLLSLHCQYSMVLVNGSVEDLGENLRLFHSQFV